ncbi:MAG: MFS transporter [Hyphomicrobiales bacterium]
MEIFRNRQATFILILLLSGVTCNAAIIPFMAVYIVKGLGMEPWSISIYTSITIVVGVFTNRLFGRWIDAGTRIAPLVLTSLTAFITANIAILIFQNYWVLVAFASVCFGVAGAAVSSMYSFGRLFAEREHLNIQKYNSYLRTMTSVGWMIGPASSFLIAGRFGYAAVFAFALVLASVWFALWLVFMPKGFAVYPKPRSSADTSESAVNKSLMYAAVACFCFAMAHVLCTSALPLFYIKEAGLPTYAPGFSLSIKTSVEIVGILSAPWLMNRFGAKPSLICAGGLAVVSFVILSQVSSIEHLVIGAALEGLYYGIFAGVGITFMQSFAGDKMASATSLYMNSLFLGGLISGASLGIIAQSFDFRTAILMASIGAISAIVVLLIMPKRGTSVAG